MRKHQWRTLYEIRAARRDAHISTAFRGATPSYIDPWSFATRHPVDTFAKHSAPSFDVPRSWADAPVRQLRKYVPTILSAVSRRMSVHVSSPAPVSHVAVKSYCFSKWLRHWKLDDYGHCLHIIVVCILFEKYRPNTFCTKIMIKKREFRSFQHPAIRMHGVNVGRKLSSILKVEMSQLYIYIYISKWLRHQGLDCWRAQTLICS